MRTGIGTACMLHTDTESMMIPVHVYSSTLEYVRMNPAFSQLSTHRVLPIAATATFAVKAGKPQTGTMLVLQYTLTINENVYLLTTQRGLALSHIVKWRNGTRLPIRAVPVTCSNTSQ